MEYKSSRSASSVKHCVAEVQITNVFKEKVLLAHFAQQKILDVRLRNLSEWTKNDKEEFKKIFGLDGNKIIKKNITMNGKVIDDSKEANMLMKDGIERIKKINSQMIRVVCEKRLCFYINNTICGNFFAVVDKYRDRNYEIAIGGKFFNHSLFGKDSQVSTLCHEMSHFVESGLGGISGGMGTDDLNKDGLPIDASPTEHNNAANNFVRTHNPIVFRNAYNIERYFEISLDEKTLTEVYKTVKEEMMKPLEIIIKTTSPDINRKLTEIEKCNE